jgi:hypothetical protein
MHRSTPFAALALAVALVPASAWAGRPLGVDNAEINAKGNGHVEAWAAREPGKADVLYVAPAYSPWQVLELSGVVARNRTDDNSAYALLARIRITETQKSGCNFLVTLGQQHFSPGGNVPFANTVATCNRADFALHANLGAAKPSGASSYGTWGIALEHDTGTFTAHIEAFGREESKPTYRVGARREVAKGWQVDGSLGRFDGETIFSLGFKVSF